MSSQTQDQQIAFQNSDMTPIEDAEVAVNDGLTSMFGAADPEVSIYVINDLT